MAWWEWFLLVVGGGYALFLIAYAILLFILGVTVSKSGLWR